jgi:hypothetical protein
MMQTATSGEVENKVERNFSSPSGAKIRLASAAHATCSRAAAWP